MGQSLSKEIDGDTCAEEGFIPNRKKWIKNKLRKKVSFGFRRPILLVTVATVVIIVVIIVIVLTVKLSHRHQSPYRPTCIQPQKGIPATAINVSNTTGVIYELLTESFLDSSEKGGGKAGDGIGDINGNFIFNMFKSFKVILNFNFDFFFIFIQSSSIFQGD